MTKRFHSCSAFCLFLRALKIGPRKTPNKFENQWDPENILSFSGYWHLKFYKLIKKSRVTHYFQKLEPPKIDLKLGQFEPLFKVRKKLKMSRFLNQLVNLNLLKGNYYKKWSLIMLEFDFAMIFWRCNFAVDATYGHAAMLCFEGKSNTVQWSNPYRGYPKNHSYDQFAKNWYLHTLDYSGTIDL